MYCHFVKESTLLRPDALKGRSEASYIIWRIISALFQLEELNIEAILDDERWKACVEDVVSEICSMKILNKLKSYFPIAELLSYFK